MCLWVGVWEIEFIWVCKRYVLGACVCVVQVWVYLGWISLGILTEVNLYNILIALVIYSFFVHNCL